MTMTTRTMDDNNTNNDRAEIPFFVFLYICERYGIEHIHFSCTLIHIEQKHSPFDSCIGFFETSETQ